MTGWSVRGRRLPALDGVRALAVLAVLAYHLDFSWARGGYLGVDLFFVLSGFLITSLLLEEHEDTGTLRLGAFWGRRARRLLPALFAMVTAVMVFVVLEGRYGNTAFIAGFDLSSLRSEALATLLYVANWWQIASQHSYFAQFSAPSPLQHTWSLAIEEQFYLLWPFVTLGLLAKGLAERRRLGLVVSVAIAVASTALMAVLAFHEKDPSRAYYGTDTRIADLAVGTVLAWLTARRPETPPRIAVWLRVAAPLALAGLLALMVTAGTSGGVPDAFMFRGGFLLASVLCAVVIADVRRQGSLLALGFAWRPVVAIGLVSYGIYLWHWPVIVFLSGQSTSLSGAGLLAARLGVIAALTVASYFLIELPVRRGWIPVRLRVVLYPLAIVVTVVAVFIGTTPSLVIKSHVRATLIRYAPVEPIRGAGGLVGEPIRVDRAISASDPLRIVLLGDSMTYVAGPGVVAALDATGEAEAFNGGDPGFGVSIDPSWRGYVRYWLHKTHADVVFYTTDWDGTAAMDVTAYHRAMLELIDVARSAGASGVVFLQYPKTHPLDAVTPAAQAGAAADIAAWNAAVAGVPALAPGRAMYFPVAPSVELNGQFSYWVSPPRDPSAPASTWDRVRRVDGVHLCPPGIVLYAAAIAADTSQAFRLPAPAAGWWVNGWQRDPIIVSGDQYCPADHPPG